MTLKEQASRSIARRLVGGAATAIAVAARSFAVAPIIPVAGIGVAHGVLARLVPAGAEFTLLRLSPAATTLASAGAFQAHALALLLLGE